MVSTHWTCWFNMVQSSSVIPSKVKVFQQTISEHHLVTRRDSPRSDSPRSRLGQGAAAQDRQHLALEEVRLPRHLGTGGGRVGDMGGRSRRRLSRASTWTPMPHGPSRAIHLDLSSSSGPKHTTRHLPGLGIFSISIRWGREKTRPPHAPLQS